ncbi:MAG: hypothetical protein R2939_19750 [Kofleriaceae bacterium]
MTKLTSSILLGALAGTSLPLVASAQDLGAARGYEISLASTTTDQARVREENGVRKLRKTDEEFTNEQASVRFSPDGRRALYVHMRTSPINEGTAMERSPEHRMQCALTALETYQEADGSVAVRRPSTAMYDIFATDNDGNEYRNCNKPELMVIAGGQYVALEFNYQAQGNGDTKRYMKVFDWDLNPVRIKNNQGQTQEQVVVMAKNNDDCSMHQSGAGQSGAPYYDVGGVTRFASWDGCNGNGADDGWFRATEVACTGTGTEAECQIKKLFDLSLAKREERSRGRCTVGGADLSFAVCTWTEGNTQPQREGTWIAAVDLNPDSNDRLLWKERLNYKQTLEVNGEDREYYAMRAQHGRVMAKGPDGNLVATDEIIFQDTGNRGGNNNDKKGGRSDIMNLAVIKTAREGFTFSMPMVNIDMTASEVFDGFEATHISLAEAVFGKGDQLIPGFTLLQGIHTAASRDAEIKTIGYDPVTKSLVNLGKHLAGASYDRHLYSNYLGNNPGNQGRNFAGSDLVRNPFEGQNGSKVQFFVAHALTGKSSLPTHMDSAVKPSAYLSLLPVAFSAEAEDPGGGYNDNLPGDDSDDDDEPADLSGRDSNAQLTGGCQTGGASSGGLVLLGLALVAVRRRRAA